MKKSWYSPLLIDVYENEDGGFEVTGIYDNGGFIQKHDVLDAIIAFCKKSKKMHSDEYREMYNRVAYDEMMRPTPKEPKTEKPPKECIIYVIRDTVRGFHKIGKATNLENRLSSLRTANPAIEVVSHYKGTAIDEKELHSFFKDLGKHIGGEWFSLCEEDLESINDYFTPKAA